VARDWLDLSLHAHREASGRGRAGPRARPDEHQVEPVGGGVRRQIGVCHRPHQDREVSQRLAHLAGRNREPLEVALTDCLWRRLQAAREHQPDSGPHRPHHL